MKKTTLLTLCLVLAACSPTQVQAPSESNDEVGPQVEVKAPVPKPAHEALTTFEVGPEGGTLDYGGLQLEVPPGAVSTTTEISLSSLDQTELPLIIPALTTFFGAAECGPDGLSFDQPVSLFIPLDQPVDPDERLALYLFDIDEQHWVDTGIPAQVTADGRYAQAQITHFTTYTALGGITGQDLGWVFQNAFEAGAERDQALSDVMLYLEDRGAQVGACTDQGRRIAGTYLGINHSIDSNKLDIYSGSRMLGAETPDASTSTMFYWMNEPGEEREGLIIDMVMAVYLGEECEPIPPTPMPQAIPEWCGPPPEVLECYYMPKVDDTPCEQEAIAQAWCDCIGHSGECPIGDPSELCYTGEYDCWGQGETEVEVELCEPEYECVTFVAPCDCSILKGPGYYEQCQWVCKDVRQGIEVEFCGYGLFSEDPWACDQP
jgi:hypothetical protein